MNLAPTQIIITLDDIQEASASWSEKWGTLIGEYDMSNLASITEVGGAVSAIAPVAGPGPTLVQNIATKQPRIDLRTYNGKPVLYFDNIGVTQYILAAMVPPLKPATIAIICQWDVVNAPTYQVVFGDTLELYARYENLEIYDGGGLSYSIADTLTHTYICRFDVDHGTSDMWRDGILLTPLVQYDAGNQKLTSLSLGSDETGYYKMKGTVAHVVVYEGIVADPAGLSAELSSKWGTL